MGAAKMLAMATVLVTILPENLLAGGYGRAVGRGAARGLVRKVFRPTKPRPSLLRVLRIDQLRDAQTKAIRLSKPRRVYRFTTLQQAKAYKRHGVPPGTHFTSGAGPGRPPSASLTKERYGLPRKRGARVEVELPAGTQVKVNKVLGGQPGYGEVKTHYKRVPPISVKKIIRLP